MNNLSQITIIFLHFLLLLWQSFVCFVTYPLAHSEGVNGPKNVFLEKVPEYIKRLDGTLGLDIYFASMPRKELGISQCNSAKFMHSNAMQKCRYRILCVRI